MLTHPYLSDKICATRLIAEYWKHGKIWVAYDFDNTVFDYHHQGHDYKDIIDLLHELRAIGCGLIVFTAAEDLDFVRSFLKTHNIPYDLINENPPFFRSAHESRKIYWNILLDDRAGLASAYRQCRALLKAVRTTAQQKGDES